MLRSVDWLVIDVSGQPICPIFHCRSPLTIEDGTDRVSRNVGNYQSTLRNVLEERRLHFFFRPKNASDWDSKALRNLPKPNPTTLIILPTQNVFSIFTYEIMQHKPQRFCVHCNWSLRINVAAVLSKHTSDDFLLHSS